MKETLIPKASKMLQKRNLVLLLSLGTVLAVAGWCINRYFLSDASWNNSSPNVVSETQEKSAKNANSSSNALSLGVAKPHLVNNANSTYRLGQTRFVRPYLGVIDTKNITSDWWLYAKSEEEARWMDAYGYPTPNEEAKLRASSLDELKKMADEGDLNAKAHFVSRKLATAFETLDPGETTAISGRMEFLMLEGGPYQATKVLQAYGKLLGDYAALPQIQRTEDQAKFIEKLGAGFKTAEFAAAIYSDDAAKTIWKTVKDEIGLSRFTFSFDGNTKNGSYPAESVVSFISYSSIMRSEKGLPPLTIAPRPQGTRGANTVYLERY